MFSNFLILSQKKSFYDYLIVKSTPAFKYPSSNFKSAGFRLVEVTEVLASALPWPSTLWTSLNCSLVTNIMWLLSFNNKYHSLIINMWLLSFNNKIQSAISVWNLTLVQIKEENCSFLSVCSLQNCLKMYSPVNKNRREKSLIF